MYLGIRQEISWFFYFVWIFLQHDVIKVNGFIWVNLYFVLVNVTLKGSLRVDVLGVKVDDDLGGFEVPNE